MNNFREVNEEDILRDWFNFREQEVFCTLTEEDKKHFIYFDEISERILKNVPKENKKYVQKQLDLLVRILRIIFAIGMKSIIEMDFVMECS